MNQNIVAGLALVAAFSLGAMLQPMSVHSQSPRRFELECSDPPGINNLRNLNKMMAKRASAGWDLVGFSGAVVCFRRPAH